MKTVLRNKYRVCLRVCVDFASTRFAHTDAADVNGVDYAENDAFPDFVLEVTTLEQRSPPPP